MRHCLSEVELDRYLKGDLGDAELRGIHEHFATCSDCRTTLARSKSANSPLPKQTPKASSAAMETIANQAAVDTSPAAKVPAFLPKIDGYRITGVLGQGGMGIVYRAIQTNLNRAVALKVLPAMVGSASPSAVQRFRREATAAARLHHTNIVPIYDFGESHDAYYYAMELIEGHPLNELINTFAQQNISTASPARLTTVLHQSTTGTPVAGMAEKADGSSVSPSSGALTSSSTGRGRAYFQQVARWMADAAEALHYAHGQGIVHRDIKPGNLILSSDGRIMITDFGLAKSSEEKSVTIVGSLLGTIRYLSPEQAMAGRLHVDHRTDIWSLGATLYELLTFQPAFPGNDEKQILSAIITRDPARPRKVASHIPAELETICQKTLDKSPDARYLNAHELAEDLRRYLNDLPIVAKRPGPIRRSAKFIKRHRALVTAATATVLVLLATAITLFALRAQRVERVNGLVADGDKDLGFANWDSAAESYNEALALDANCVTALGNLAIAKKELYNASLPQADPKQLDEGVEYCRRALDLDPARTRVWNTKGVLLKMQGKFDEAAEAYKKATELDPKDPFAWANLAAVNVLRRKLIEAEANLHTAAPLVTPSDPLSCGVLRDLAVVHFLRGRVEEAVADIAGSLKCNPKDERSLLYRARMQLTIEGRVNAEAARDDIASADRLSGEKNPLVKRYLALANLRLKRFDDAVTYARDALALGDMAAYDQLIIAIAERHLGHADAAKSALTTAIDAWPKKLDQPDQYEPSAAKGFLWFESADELLGLRAEIEAESP
jgi:serine/threonine protein kinase